MAAKKPCIEQGCSKAATGPRCPDHQQAWEAARGSRHARGYGSAHDRRRTSLLRLWRAAVARGLTWYCEHCGEPLVPGQPVDAAHGTPLRSNPAAVASGLAHPACNRGDREAPGWGRVVG